MAPFICPDRNILENLYNARNIKTSQYLPVINENWEGFSQHCQNFIWTHSYSIIHVPQCKDTEIKIQGASDLPKIINRRLGSKTGPEPSASVLEADAHPRANPSRRAPLDSWWGHSEIACWPGLDPLVPAKLSIRCGLAVLGHTGLLTGLKGGHSTTGRHGNPAACLLQEQNGAGREREAFVRCLLWARHDE